MDKTTKLTMEELIDILQLIHDIEYPQERLDRIIQKENDDFYKETIEKSLKIG